MPYSIWPPAPGHHPGGVPVLGSLPDVQGISLVAAVRGDGLARAQVLIEYESRLIPGLQLKTLRTPGYHITAYGGRPYGELYDLRADPDEFVNRWNDPALRGIRSDLTATLLDEVLRTEGRWPPRVASN